MRGASLLALIGLVGLVELLGLLAPVSQAQAGARICKSRVTGSHDRARLHAAMQEVMPRGEPMDGIPSLCINPGYSSASMSTWARLGPDGVTQWWDVNCARDRRTQWSCETPRHRQLIWVYAPVAGLLRRVEVRFDEATGFAQARRRAVQALQILQDQGSAPPSACSNGDATQEENRSEWRAAQRRDALTPQDTSVVLSVETRDGVVGVRTAGDLELSFTDVSGQAPSTEPSSGVCWKQWVVVN